MLSETNTEVVLACKEALIELDTVREFTVTGEDLDRIGRARGDLLDVMLGGIDLTQQDILRLLWKKTMGPIYRGIVDGKVLVGVEYKVLSYSSCFLVKDEDGYHLFSKTDLYDTRLEEN